MRRHVVLVAVCAMVLSGVAACDPMIGGAPGVDARCRVKFSAPYRPVITTGRLIRGDATVLCTGPVDYDHAVLLLQRKSATGWDTRDTHRSEAIPYPSAVALTVLVECAPGTWQLVYDVSARYQGQTARESNGSDPLTVSSYDDCKVAR